jgi:hypothetical protein
VHLNKSISDFLGNRQNIIIYYFNKLEKNTVLCFINSQTYNFAIETMMQKISRSYQILRVNNDIYLKLTLFLSITGLEKNIFYFFWSNNFVIFRQK